MGRNSQQRRAQKKRRQEQQARAQQRAGEHARPPSGAARPSSGQQPRADDRSRANAGPDIERLVMITAQSVQKGATKDVLAYGVKKLLELEASPPTDGGPRAVASRLLKAHVTRLLDAGWQPADLAHFVKREWTQRAHRLIVAMIAAQSRDVDAANRAPEAWLGQLEDLGVYDPKRGAILGGQGDVVRGWAATERLYADEILAILLQLVGQVQTAAPLSFLIDPPSQWSASNRGSLPKPSPSVPIGDVDAKALKLIRALLAKAEATTFEAEAETFTAKAQEMMTRHSIDAAVLASANKGSGAQSGIESRRVHIDNPYADEKATFLSIIADVNGARAIWSPDAGFVTVMGFPVDLHLTDLLFTSLLVQATHAAAESTSHDRRSRTPSYRRAFLLSYAYRIGERLEAAKRQTSAVAAEDYGDSLLPILADKQAAVDAAYEEAFPNSTPMKGRSLDAAGYHAGRAAAERAHIGAGEAIARGAT